MPELAPVMHAVLPGAMSEEAVIFVIVAVAFDYLPTGEFINDNF